ncbi:MAG: Rieske 2Fe-2S domain-containing protein, partial [Candidatus Eremiobacteraeota bacterium]|nr:Rieske 2Fe-2S domain-containing protein [Candidatus Eremiobacteraeota bacterium]
MSVLTDRPTQQSAYRGYYRDPQAEPDLFLCAVERGTPGGEYLRRFWHPVAYLNELGKVPLRVRALGEDLVVFKTTGSGEIGCLQLHCCHRNASLEFGIITQQGIRCCYHGREFAVDGTCIDIPGDPAAERLKPGANQGGYPTHVYAGIVFVYMGPPERIPVFPVLDRFELPGIAMVPGRRLDLDCNWLQMKENAVDPHHTAILHLIPQLRGTQHFPGEFGVSPELKWY